MDKQSSKVFVSNRKELSLIKCSKMNFKILDYKILEQNLKMVKLTI